MFSKKKTECRVCGYRFTPERENIYTAEEPRSALEMLTAAPTRFSAVDCPICGCQIRLADRAPLDSGEKCVCRAEEIETVHSQKCTCGLTEQDVESGWECPLDNPNETVERCEDCAFAKETD